MDISGIHVPNLKIEGKHPAWRVYLDGVEIPTRQLNLSLEAGRMPVATIEMFVGDVSVEADCLVDLLAHSLKDKIHLEP